MTKYLNKNSLADEKNFIEEGGLRIANNFKKKNTEGNFLFSIITVTKNSEKTIERTISSVLNHWLNFMRGMFCYCFGKPLSNYVIRTGRTVMECKFFMITFTKLSKLPAGRFCL